MDDASNSTLGDYHVIQANIVEEDVSAPLDGDIQHHTAVQAVIIGSKTGKLGKLSGFQLCHKAHSTDIYAENGNPCSSGCLGHMKDRTDRKSVV